MSQVRRQNELRFHQREQQHRDDDGRYLREELTALALDHEQRHEGDDGCQHAEGDGQRHLLGADDHGIRRRHAALEMRIYVLSGDDGVVHDDAEHEYECEQADDVDGHIEQGQQRKRTGKGNGYPHADPQRNREAQEQCKQREN